MIRFIAVQLASTVLMVLGWALLLVLPYRNGKYLMLDGIYGNSEDGCEGPRWYNPLQSRWRAYLWSAWRNSTNNFNRSQAWKGGPFWRWQNAGKTWYAQAGFRPDTGWSVLSAGRHDGDFPYG